MKKVGLLSICGIFLFSISVVFSGENQGASYLKNGDRWLLLGDSITNTDTYRQLTLRVLQHYHPDADIMVGNSAVNGVQSDYQEKRDFKPTMVSLMVGMNNIIHGDHDYSAKPEKISAMMEKYRADITAKVQEYKKLGADFVLMSPTYTDERVSSYFNTTCTRIYLEKYGQVIREVAEKEGCAYVPAGEEMEAYQDILGANQSLRPDGVHPYGLGQYQIARSLWEHLNMAGQLGGPRTATAKAPECVPVKVELASRFMHAASDGITLKLSAENPATVKARWSLDGEKGEESLAIGKDAVNWKVPATEKALTVNLGLRKWLVVDLASDGKSSLYVIDLVRTKVLKLENGAVSGTFESAKERPEGKVAGQWTIKEQGNELQISGSVADGELVATRDWAFARDGLHIYLDARPASRFANNCADRDVYMVILGVRDNPLFAVSPISWLGTRTQYMMSAAGGKTGKGYDFWLGLRGGICTYRKFDPNALDYYGINMYLVDADDKPNGTEVVPAMSTQFNDNPVTGINALMIVDRKGTFPGKETTNLQLFGK